MSRMSPSTLELHAALIAAFVDGDRWVVCGNASTARYSGAALVQRGLAEFDGESMRELGYSMRLRLSTAWVEDNGWTGRDWRAAADEMKEEAA